LVNKVIRLFRAEYSKAVVESGRATVARPVSASKELSGEETLRLLQSRGALSELNIEHPTLPFVGIVDLVRAENDAIVILDFKTGESKPAHETQVLIYGVLWWRKTGRPPDRVEVRYPANATALAVNAQKLAEMERKLEERIEKAVSTLENPPAVGCLGDHCRYCDVRQFCDAHWGAQPDEFPPPKVAAGRAIDVELIVDGKPSSNGFSATTRNGSSTCTVVHSSDGDKVHGPFAHGEALRVIGARMGDSRETLELMPWTEVFHQ
jgi:CRISPR/Cas system-associated exonuclease Cas4 (RecB family)